MATSDKILHAANVLVCAAGVGVAPNLPAKAALFVRGLQSLREVFRQNQHPEIKKLTETVAARIGEISEGRAEGDPRIQLPDMILSFEHVSPAMVLDARWQGDRLAEGLYAQVEAGPGGEYRTPAYREMFLREVGSILTNELAPETIAQSVDQAFQVAVLDGLDRIEDKQDQTLDVATEIKAILAQQTLTRDQMFGLAEKFGIENARHLSDDHLQSLLLDKAQEYQVLKAQIEAIDERTAGLGNLKAAAQEAIERLDFAEVENLLSRVDEVETGIAAETKELRARNALLGGRADEAARHFTAAADAFANIDPQETVRRRYNYAHDLYEHGLRYGGAGLPGAITLYRAALEVRTRDQHPVDWAMTQNNLAAALADQGVRTGGAEGAALLGKAVDAYRAALEVRTRDQHPVDWAATQNNLAAALYNQGVRTGGAEGEALLGQAVDAYRAALEVRTRDQHPVDWAATQNNLAIALSDQGVRTGGAEGAALLGQAVDALRAALEVRTRDQHPVDWAGTQNNLAAALRDQGVRTGGAEGAVLLGQAVNAYRAALEVRTRDQHPVQWAATQNNLANALSDQGVRTDGAEGEALLGQAVDAYRAALEVRTRDQHPVDWAMTQENLAIAELKWAGMAGCDDPQAHLRAALGHVDLALEVYDPQHMPYDHGTATALRDDILAAIDAQGGGGQPARS